MATRGRPPHPDILTPREWEVFELVREGLNNRQIAERLDITRAAVKYHVSEILGKLAAVSREEASAWDPRQRPDWTPRWDPTRRPAWATALAPLGLFWRGLTGGLARSAGALSTVTSVGLGVALVAGLTTLGVLVMRTRASSNDASPTPPAVVVQSTSEAAIVVQSTAEPGAAATGKIAFLSRRDGNQEIYVMNADGSGETNLSNGPGDDSFGGWSPDGSRIAFTSDRDGNWEIYVVNTDGSGLTNLSKDPGDDGVVRNESIIGGWAPAVVAWSPDGSRIAFISSRDGNNEVYVVAADGSGQTRLTNDPCDDDFNAWSPDGSRIAFTSHDLAPATGNCGSTIIYVVNADGSNVTRLANITNDAAADCPPDHVCPVAVAVGLAWSRDGSSIVFNRILADASYEIYVMNADGSGLTNLTTYPAGGVWPAWSPDGSRIAFDLLAATGGIAVVAADGSGFTRLTNGPGDDYFGAWSPDGSRIAFNSGRGETSEIYVMAADGSGETNLTNNPREDAGPVWSPDGTRMAFDTYRDGNQEIYVMNADGSGQTNLTNSLSPDYSPVWSPVQY